MAMSCRSYLRFHAINCPSETCKQNLWTLTIYGKISLPNVTFCLGLNFYPEAAHKEAGKHLSAW